MRRLRDIRLTKHHALFAGFVASWLIGCGFALMEAMPGFWACFAAGVACVAGLFRD